METTYIKEVFTVNVGGNCMVDFVKLESGALIGINDECVCVYASMDDFYTAYREPESLTFPTREQQLVEEWSAYCDANDLPNESAEDVLRMGISDEQRQDITRFIERWDAACDTGYI